MRLEMAYNCTISLTKNNKSKPSDSQTGMIFYKQQRITTTATITAAAKKDNESTSHIASFEELEIRMLNPMLNQSGLHLNEFETGSQ